MLTLNLRRNLVTGLAALSAAVLLTVNSVDAQNRSNKGGEMRGKDRAEQVKTMNEDRKAGKELKAKGKEMKAKKGKKGNKK